MTGRFKISRTALPVLVPMLACSVLGVAAPLSAQSQDSVSRAVVQPLPPAAVSDLNTALLRLAKDRRDVDALIAAGLASLELDDMDAAIGFFGRAKALSPENPRISEGMAAAYVRGGRPVEALKLFEEADNAGIASGSLWADRGLAYDLVGQNGAAQSAYREALSRKDDAAVRQRLALSYAIAGDRRSFEEALKPLIDEKDYGAYRTRAFGLAMLGNAEDAIEIARAVMPRDLAGRMEPYLRFMPRLTKSQQAAAANLGIYPSASRIGRDDPRIASAAGTLGAPETPDGALEPRGNALGTAVAAQESQGARSNGVDPRDPLTRTIMRQPERQASAAPGAAQPAAASQPPPPTPAATGTPAQSGETRAAQAELPASPGNVQPAQAQAPVRVAALSQSATPASSGPPAGPPAQARTDTAPLAPANAGQPESRSVQASTATAAPAQPASLGKMDLADAFADFAEPTTVAVSGADVVDISAIDPVREVAAPEPPPAPKRIWLQLGIGQNRSLLRSDWRLKYRKVDALKGKGPFVTPWGQTNRLLAGPFDSQADAREALNALAAADIDSFVWTSAEGQETEDLR